MRLLRRNSNGELSLTDDLTGEDTIPPYAILSHTWGKSADEVTFNNITYHTGNDKAGYQKIKFCSDQAEKDGLRHFWVDTCCINKAIKVELLQAISSMFRWYQNAAKCYVFLSDVQYGERKAATEITECSCAAAFLKSKWFTRGWTLQELLAPRSVEFFSKEGKRLGDKTTLEKHIHQATGIPNTALRGTPLSHFSINDRLKWMQHRDITIAEDRVYCLIGIFGVQMTPFPGESVDVALQRLIDEAKILERCLRNLRRSDPHDDKKRIESTKGGLLRDSYRWVIDHKCFKQWRDDPQSRLLWIKGDPGKGKTMLLCGIINELNNSVATTAHLCYFFCQATDSRINSATAVLRGLLFMLLSQQPSLVAHLRKKHDQAGKALFEDANAWVVLCDVFTNILQDSSLDNVYFFVDALDECVKDLERLLAFIVQKSSLPSRVKWILTSRNHPNIEQRLRLDNSGMRLSLELKENAAQVSRAVDAYINYRLLELEQIEQNQSLKSLVRAKMQQKANGTFLWVSLVMKELKEVLAWEVLEVLEEVPTELTEVYRRMMEHINKLKRQNPELCRQILATVVATYRPLHLQELSVLADVPNQGSNVEETTATIVKMCGSFLTLREDHVYVIHQSARDFLSDEPGSSVFPSGTGEFHGHILSRSIQAMSRALHRDMYRLDALGYAIEQVQQPEPDPLVTVRYSCVYWVDHLHDSVLSKRGSYNESLRDDSAVHMFLKRHYLYWLEALSLCRSMSNGVVSMAKLQSLVQAREGSAQFAEIVHDAYRFAMYHRGVIAGSPLQVYASALLFSPTKSLVRKLFQHEEPEITIKPPMSVGWSACLQTLEGHSNAVNSVAFSHDSARLASASYDKTVKIWDASSGACLQTLEGHSNLVLSVAFSHDSTRLASASSDKTVKIWDASSGACLQTLEGHSGEVNSVAFSHDSARLASASYDKTVKIWDASSGACLQTLEGHSNAVNSVAFSHDSARLVSASYDKTVKIWDASSGACLQTLEGSTSYVAFDSIGSHIYTDRGLTALIASEHSNAIVTETQQSSYQDIGISLDSTWITYDARNLLWLPIEYRPACLAVSGRCVGIGGSSGKVWLCCLK